MSNSNNAPLTIVGTIGSNTYGVIGLGTSTGALNPPGGGQGESYWMVVVDLTNLQIVANLVSDSPTVVPPQIQQYSGNNQYLLIVVSLALTVDQVPQGALYNFLVDTGSGPLLQQAEQINEQFSSAVLSDMSYILVATMDTGSTPGFEELSFHNSTIMTLQLMPVDVNGTTVYTPIMLGN